ncbi:MAG: hypothetical protein HGA61_00015 [Candidatus Moranbacteria bacterium]|nr:hypothetical protein [Candidatus Moranbacteria bacterium]
MSDLATAFNRKDALTASRRQVSSPADFGEFRQTKEDSKFKQRAQEKMLEASFYNIDKKLERKNNLNKARREDSKSNDYSQEGENGHLRFDEVKNLGKYGREMFKIGTEVEEGREFKALIDAIKLSRELRKGVNDHLTAPWLIAISAAIASDLLDTTWFLGVLIKIGLFIFLWGKGKLKYRIIRFIMVTLDLIPIIGYLPMTTGSVLFCWHESNKKRKKSEEKLKKLKEKFGEDIGK